MSERGCAEGGFTLMEVLVSLAILGVALSVLLDVFSTGLSLAHDTKDEVTASGFAQSLLNELGTAIPLQEGDVSGQSDDGYAWQIRATPYGNYDDRQSWHSNPLLVTVTVRWQAGKAPQSLSLTTLRLAPSSSGVP